MRADLLFAKFCSSRKIHHSLKYGLTLFEVLIVLGCIIFFLVIFLPVFSHRHDHPSRYYCANNIKQILIGYLLYAGENNDNLPRQPDTYTLNEMSKETLDALMRCLGYDLKEFRANNQGGLPPQQIFYCPSNLSQRKHMADFWNASNDYRAVGYFFITDSKNGRDKIKGSGEKIWLKKLNVDKPSDKELITDMLMCDEFNYRPPKFPNGNFAKCPTKILGEKAFETSSHLKDDKEPAGGNIGFADGHVDWRPFQEMERRYGQNPVCWW